MLESFERRARPISLGLLALVLVPVSLLRLIDGDEGYLLLAARLSSEGQTLYADFFFPQTPLHAQLFELWFRIFGPGWYTARTLVALMAIATGWLVYEYALLACKRPLWAALAVYLFVGCGFTLGWLTVAKTYGPSLLCMVAAAYVLERGGRYSAFAAGVLILLAAMTRLYVGIIGINAIVFVLRRHGCGRTGLLELGKLAAGALVGALPVVPYFVVDFDAAYFGIFEWLSMRSFGQETLLGPFERKRVIFLSLFGVRFGDGAASLQFFILTVLAASRLLLSGTRSNSYAATVWITLLFANLLPEPTYTQYACLLVPFLAVEIATLAAQLHERVNWRVALGLLTLYGALGSYDGERFLRTGFGVMGVEPNQWPPAWRIWNVRDVSRAIDEVAKEHDIKGAGSWWPGYFLTTKTEIIPALVNDFGFRPATQLSPERRQHLRLMTHEDVMLAIARRQPRFFVQGNWSPPYAGLLPLAGYERVRQVENVGLWVAPEGKPFTPLDIQPFLAPQPGLPPAAPVPPLPSPDAPAPPTTQ